MRTVAQVPNFGVFLAHLRNQAYSARMTSAYESGQVPPILQRHRLHIAREYAGLEQEQLADIIGVSRNTISNAEKGRVHPRKIVLNAWALACGVPVSWLRDDLPGADSQPTGKTGVLSYRHRPAVIMQLLAAAS